MRIKIQGYFTILNSYGSQLQNIQAIISKSEYLAPEHLNVLNNVNSATQWITFLVLVVLPITLLLVYTVFQGSSYRLVYSDFKSILKDKKYFLRFLIMTVFYGLFMFLVFRFVLPDYNSQEIFASENALNNLLRESGLTLLFLFAGFCVAITYFALLRKDQIWNKTLNETFSMFIKKPLIILLNLIHYLFSFFRGLLVTSLVLSFALKEALFFSLGMNIILLLITNLVISSYKIYLVNKINE